jgi:ligand-binding sensor domain-containing protein/DNA-binding CsgD family transcriptional regulator
MVSLQFVLVLKFLVLFTHGITLATDIPRLGIPYVQNFTKNIYSGGNQNWAIAKDKNGVMYFANNNGLLSYDGKYWNKHELPNKQIIRSVGINSENLIYTGAFEEFGYWSHKNRKLTYTSLTKLLPNNLKLTGEVWRISVVDNRVYFQTFSHLYLYQMGKITVIPTSGSLLFTHQVDKRILVEVIDNGLFEIKGNKLEKLNGSESIGKSGVYAILPFKNNRLLIATSKNGLFLFDGNKFQPFENEANNLLKTYQINNGVKLMSNYFAFGTILNGIVIIDENGKLLQLLNKSNSLQNNTVLSLFKDDFNNLWAGLDNGIDRIELNSPLSFYFDKTGKFGTVYSSIIFKNNIYLGTNQGLFYSKWNEGSTTQPNFTLIPNSQGQVWDLSAIDGQLLCGHNNGTFRVNGNQFEKISSITGGWTLKPLKSNANYLIQGTYTGLVLYKKNNGSWIFSHRVEGFGEPSRYVEQDHNGNIWVSHAYKGLYKISLSNDLKRTTKVEYLDERKGLPSAFNINTFNLENKVVFSSVAGFYIYDDLSDKFSKYQALNGQIGSFSKSNNIINAGKQKYWFIKQGSASLVDFSVVGKVKIDSNRFSILDGRMVQKYESINQISSNTFLISIDDGYAIYDEKLSEKTLAQNKLPKVIIGKIEDVTEKYVVLTENVADDDEIEIPFTKNSIRISFALPYYRLSKIKFQYYLEGYANQWSEWNTNSQKDFTKLGSGTYKFKVRAKIDDKTMSEITEVEFVILPPWYASKWALAGYFVLIVLGLIVGKKIYERRLERDQEKIALKIKQEHQEILKKEAEEAEKQIEKLEREKLQTDLAGKNRELSNSTMNLVYKNELLQKINFELNKLSAQKEQRPQEDQLRKINKIIDEAMNDERDWNLFENSFNEAHENFFKKLKINHPDLVPNDLKLCAYLRMNMSSKEMASLLNISVRGVEIRRYRLRKKLSVPHDKNLTEFLIEV